ncbi:PLP-dependent aminotransferase family protein [Aciduricibacillus chroicocephali]|uniref:PLP-dependent aminotransferase family protein n=1 Tax=Aciduricibacillus chroicocephali TaxID=3054939 RepID=A0ABY9KYJ2_9BACI|nr:PLP-dependent aminotransferase family protein [Bacillaceae bacterium 44XB]
MPINSFENYPMSWKPSFSKEEKPIYKTIATQLESDIIEGVLLPGTKLPPQRELADYLDLNVSTISKAFKVCELKGLLSARVGSGTFVSYDALANAYLLEETKPKLIEMGATLPDNASFEPLMLQLKSMLREENYEKWFGYGRAGESLWQKEAALKLIERGGYQATADQILFATGAQNTIAAAIASLCSPGDRLGVDQHTYPGLKIVAAMLSVQLVPIRSVNNQMCPEALEDACKNEYIKGIYVIPDNHNPTACSMSEVNRKAIAKVAQKYNLFVLEDASYHLLAESPPTALAAFAPEQVIYIASLSKSIAPGLRMAYVAVPEQFKEQLSRALYNLNVSVSPLLSELAARTILSNEFELIIKNHQNQAIHRNRLVNHYLSEWTCLGANTSIFRWLFLPGNLSGAEFEKLAADRGVQVYAAERFAVGNSCPERAVRIAVCAMDKLEELEEGLRILNQLMCEVV